jgi:hypothetical protein
MTSEEQIDAAATRHGWDRGVTRTGAATYQRLVKGRTIDPAVPRLLVWYGTNGRVNSASLSRPSGSLYQVSGGRAAIIKILRGNGQ